MTLDKVVVKLGAAVREPGVLFVALSRVKHPDDLMLDDDFPALFEILKQSKHPSFQKRQNWEKEMRAKFARTLRLHMRDADRYCHPGLHVWTADDSALVDVFLEVLRKMPRAPDPSTVKSAVSALRPHVSETDLSRVWDRMQTFPYIFEVAAATGTLDTLTLQGTTRLESSTAHTPSLTTKIHYDNWHVALKDFTEFRLRDKLSPALLEHFAQIFRAQAPPHLVLARQTHAKKHSFSLPPPPYSEQNTSSVCFPYFSPVGYLTFYILKRTRAQFNDDPHTKLLVLQHADVYDEHTRTTTSHFRQCFPTASVEFHTLPQEQVSDFSLLATFAADSISEDHGISNDLLTQVRGAVMSYVETLEPLAAKATNASLHELLRNKAELRVVRDACFTAAFKNTPSKAQVPVTKSSDLDIPVPPSTPISAPPPAAPPDDPPAQTPAVEYVPPPESVTASSVDATQQSRSSRAGDAAQLRSDAAFAHGIGDVATVRKREREALTQTREGTDQLFGATRAAQLREQLRRSRAAAKSAPPTTPLLEPCPTADAWQEDDCLPNTVEEVQMDPEPNPATAANDTEGTSPNKRKGPATLEASSTQEPTTKRQCQGTGSNLSHGNTSSASSSGTPLPAIPTDESPLKRRHLAESAPSPASTTPIVASPFLRIPGADDKPRPFFNLGASCFINAALTALFGPIAFRNVLSQIFETDEARLRHHLWPTAVSISGTHREKDASPAMTHEERLAVTYAASLRAPTDSDTVPRGRAMIPYLFTHRFYHRTQEDANEFLQTIMMQTNAPRLHRTCQGLDTPILQCRDCLTEHPTEPEWFNWLNLSLVHDAELHVTIQDALDAHFQPETLEDEDFRFRCTNPGCQSTRLPYKASKLSIPPQVLCIQLKRWRTNRVEDALLHDVQCDAELCCQGTWYVRRSVVCHMGNTPKRGHYTCRIHYPSSNGDWWYYNNSERRLATPAELLTTTPVRGSTERTYLAFYERR